MQLCFAFAEQQRLTIHRHDVLQSQDSHIDAPVKVNELCSAKLQLIFAGVILVG